MMPVFASAQSYSFDQIKQASDNELKKLVGETLFQACKYDKKGYYSYLDSNGKMHWQILKKHKSTKGDLVGATISYKIDYHVPDCAAYSTISGIILIKLDKSLSLADQPNLSFIPQFIFKHENCNLLTKEEALALADGRGFKKGKDLHATLEYIPFQDMFKWTITNQVPKDSTLQKHYSMQTMIINAQTRKVINNYLQELPEPASH